MQTVDTRQTSEMLSRHTPTSPPTGRSSLLTRIAEARSGERWTREDLLQQYTPLVLNVLSHIRGRYIQVGRDPEIGIGLQALSSAIDGYQPERGSFIAFVTLIIKRRLIDYDRGQKKRMEWTFSDLESDDDEGSGFSKMLSRLSMEQQQLNEEADDRREELGLYAQRLQEFGIQLVKLEADSPKREVTRRKFIDCALRLVQNHRLREQLLRTKELPIKELVEIVPMARKTLERNRRYIIAMALVFLGGFKFLGTYPIAFTEQVGA